MREVGRFQASTTIRTWHQVRFCAIQQAQDSWKELFAQKGDRTDYTNTVVTYSRIFAGRPQPSPGPGSVPPSITVELYRPCAATLRDCVIFPAISPQSGAGRCCYLWCSQPGGGRTRCSVGHRATLQTVSHVDSFSNTYHPSLLFLLWPHP